MLVIRAEQMDIFQKTALLSFEDQMVAHLAEFSPPLYRTVGEEQMRKVVQLGMSQATKYGFTYRGPVRLYLELMLLFGSYFDTDPQYPWATEILTNKEVGSQMQRAEWLYEKTMDYRKKVAGPEDVYTLEALKKIAVFARNPISMPADNYIPALLREIALIYPQKAAYVGKAGLEALIRKGIVGAQRQRFTTMRGAALVATLMLAFGCGCGIDPLYPWIGKTLNNEAIANPDDKAKHLEKKAVIWLDHVLKYFERDKPV